MPWEREFLLKYSQSENHKKNNELPKIEEWLSCLRDQGGLTVKDIKFSI